MSPRGYRKDGTPLGGWRGGGRPKKHHNAERQDFWITPRARRQYKTMEEEEKEKVRQALEKSIENIASGAS